MSLYESSNSSHKSKETTGNINKFVKDVQTQPNLQAELIQHFKTNRLKESSVLEFARVKGYEVGYERGYILELLEAEQKRLEDNSDYDDLLTEYKHKYREFDLVPTERPLAMLFINTPVFIIDRVICSRK
ncbi:MAG TPA: hypothetical protein PLE99_05845 [Candidatus Thiothrix moscowensis]|uniref:hypothetical protein n=1 Tax=unclassified Thiothrix TaxID=2636184 RepID=UPI0025DA9590|nr:MULTISPECIES: hypothetical protein [unclassified Thiothrix]HRJ52267.1 hypothetical protein [Candidatus Thiothrix moscowensis]HRJ92582.1 hypothetical protein [Candidatus Thiothrix moscowensis]